VEIGHARRTDLRTLEEGDERTRSVFLGRVGHGRCDARDGRQHWPMNPVIFAMATDPEISPRKKHTTSAADGELSATGPQ